MWSASASPLVLVLRPPPLVLELRSPALVLVLRPPPLVLVLRSPALVLVLVHLLSPSSPLPHARTVFAAAAAALLNPSFATLLPRDKCFVFSADNFS